jgi:hypothetical protein
LADNGIIIREVSNDFQQMAVHKKYKITANAAKGDEEGEEYRNTWLA